MKCTMCGAGPSACNGCPIGSNFFVSQRLASLGPGQKATVRRLAADTPADLRKLLAQHLCDIQTVHARHVYVHQHHVRQQLASQTQGLIPIRGFTDDFQPLLTREAGLKPFTHNRVVVGNQYFDFLF